MYTVPSLTKTPASHSLRTTSAQPLPKKKSELDSLSAKEWVQCTHKMCLRSPFLLLHELFSFFCLEDDDDDGWWGYDDRQLHSDNDDCRLCLEGLLLHAYTASLDSFSEAHVFSLMSGIPTVCTQSSKCNFPWYSWFSFSRVQDL